MKVKNMPRNHVLSEILTTVGNADHFQQAVDLLKENDTPALRAVLQGVFDKNIIFNTKIPSYRVTPAAPGCATNSLFSEYRRFYIFVEGSSNVSLRRREALLAQVLESIDAEDAILVEQMLKKDLSPYKMTRDVVVAAFPNLLGI